MRKFYLLAFTFLTALAYQTQGQNSFSFSCARDTILNGCNPGCITLTSRIPDIRSSTNAYVVNPISGAGGCFAPYTDPNIPGTPTSITQDDRYSETITLPFRFPFFGTIFDSLHLSGNGLVSFDPAIRLNDFSHYGILSSGTALSAITGTPLNVPSTLYNRALIMGPYHDINIAATPLSASPNRRIKYDVVGVAPHRKWIASFYKIPLFDCETLIENTHQIVLYEATGIVEVFVNSVQNCLTWNQGRAMIGMQNYNRDQGIMAPGRAATDAPWGSVNMNESWRFVPAAGPTLYRSVALYDLAGTLVSTGDTVNVGSNTFEVSFPNVCPTGNTTYIIRSVYENIMMPGTFITGTDTVNILTSSPLSVSPTIVGASCATSGLGSVTLTVSGAPGPFEFSIDGGVTWQPSNVFTLAPGTYTIQYREIGGACAGTTQVLIPSTPNLLTAAYNFTNILCNGSNTGSIVINASNGTAPYEYSIDGGLNYQPGNTFNNLPAGPYNIRIRDNTGCLRDTAINITQPTALSATSASADATCSATPNGNITVTAGGGTPGYQYSIDGTSFQASNVFTVSENNYVVTIRDANGCLATFNDTVNLINNLTLQLTSTATSLCLGASAVLNTTTNLAGVTYSWTGAGLDDYNIASPTATPTVPGTTNYSVIATLGACTQNANVAILADAQVVVSAGDDVTITLGDQVQLNGNITGTTSFLWTSIPIDASLSSATVLNPIATPSVTTVYRLSGVNAAGCTGFDEITVNVIPYCIKVANAFTPNGDGNNDLWKVYESFECLRNVSVHVFNRYGSKVYESRDYRNNWDGRYQGKSVPDATYYAVIDFLLVSGKTFTVKTDLTVLR